MDIERDDDIRGNSQDEGMITIVVKTLSSNTYRIKAKNDISISELKNILEEKTSIPPSKQRLLYQGRALKDELTIRDYKIQDEQAIHLVERPTTTNNENEERAQTTTRPSAPFPNRFTVTTSILVPQEFANQNNTSGLHQSNLSYTVRPIDVPEGNNTNENPDTSLLLNIRNSISSCYNPSDPLVLVESLLIDLENRVRNLNSNIEESNNNDVNNEENIGDSTNNNENASDSTENQEQSQNVLSERERIILNRMSEMMRRVTELQSNPQVSTRKYLSLMHQLSVCSNICSSVLMTTANRSVQSTLRIGFLGTIPSQDISSSESDQPSENNRSSNNLPPTGPLQFLLNNVFSNAQSGQNQQGQTMQSTNTSNSNSSFNPLQFLFQNQNTQSHQHPSNSTPSPNSNISQSNTSDNQSRGRTSLLGLIGQFQIPGLNLNSPNNHNAPSNETDSDISEPSNTNDIDENSNQMSTTNEERVTMNIEAEEDYERIIENDIARQENIKPQVPFSDSYLEGQNGKKRKLAVEEDPNTLVCKFLRKSVEKTRAKPMVNSENDDDNNEEIINLANCTSNKYLETLKEDVKDKISDDEYKKISERYPNTRKKFE